MDTSEAFVLCSRLAAIGLIVSSAEQLALLQDFDPGGAYDSRVTTAGMAAASSVPVKRALVFGTAPLILALGVRLSAGLGLLLNSSLTSWMTGCWIAAMLSIIYTRWRNRYGGEDGADQMMSIMTVAFGSSLLMDRGNHLAPLALYFIGAQACLAYVTAGVSKLISPQWRSGGAIQGVLSTRTYGMERWAQIFGKSYPLALAACWGTIILETCFLAAPFIPRIPLTLLFMTTAAFHAVIAFVMGLNGFFWSFVATYPAIAYLNQAVRNSFHS